MTRRIRVVVTAEDIAGATSVSDSCPVARALHRSGFPDARVDPSRFWLGSWSPGISVDRFRLTKRVNAYANAFDRGKPIQPATFYLEGPDA